MMKGSGDVRGTKLKVREDVVRAAARRLAELCAERDVALAISQLTREVEDAGLRGALLDAAFDIGELGIAGAFAKYPDYFPDGLVEALTVLEATGDWAKTVGRWGEQEPGVEEFDERLRSLVRENAALFGYADGVNPYELILVLLERLTLRRDLAAALASAVAPAEGAEVVGLVVFSHPSFDSKLMLVADGRERETAEGYLGDREDKSKLVVEERAFISRSLLKLLPEFDG